MTPHTAIKELAALLRIGVTLTSTRTTEEVLYALVHEIAKTVDVVRCSVILLDRSNRTARVIATHENPSLHDLPIELRKYPEIEESLMTGEAVVVHDVSSDPRMVRVFPQLKQLGIQSIAVIPIVYHEQVLGTLFLRTSTPNRMFADQQIVFCKAAARMAANTLVSLSRYQLVVREKEELADLAGRDSLTRLYNHSTLARRIQEELGIAQRYGRALSYLMLDLDNFKAINDTCGHRGGDEVLRRVARTIRHTIRRADIPARYGGDEFGIVLPETDVNGGYIQAERIRERIKKLRVPIDQRMLTISASIGVATFPHEAITSAEDLIRKADEALYVAKSRGKDRVISADAIDHPRPTSPSPRNDSAAA